MEKIEVLHFCAPNPSQPWSCRLLSCSWRAEQLLIAQDHPNMKYELVTDQIYACLSIQTYKLLLGHLVSHTFALFPSNELLTLSFRMEPFSIQWNYDSPWNGQALYVNKYARNVFSIIKARYLVLVHYFYIHSKEQGGGGRDPLLIAVTAFNTVQSLTRFHRS